MGKTGDHSAARTMKRGNTNGSDFILYTHSHNKTFWIWDKKQQKEKRWEIKTNNHHTHTYNLIWKPHIHTGHPSGMISATPLIHDRRRRYSWCNRNKLTLRSYPTFSFVSMDSIFVCVREPIYVYICAIGWSRHLLSTQCSMQPKMWCRG